MGEETKSKNTNEYTCVISYMLHTKNTWELCRQGQKGSTSYSQRHVHFNAYHKGMAPLIEAVMSKCDVMPEVHLPGERRDMCMNMCLYLQAESMLDVQQKNRHWHVLVRLARTR
jgi:hypothetical protein